MVCNVIGTGFIGMVICAEIAVSKENEKIHISLDAEVFVNNARTLPELVLLFNSILFLFTNILNSLKFHDFINKI
jgi:ABC-type arginine transport system permease subunit